jgi:YD repeat-containing protein
VEESTRADGQAVSRRVTEYLLEDTGFGEWTPEMIRTDVDGEVSETHYNACCGRPLSIRHGTEVASFSYDTNGHITRKSTPAQETQLTYDPASRKVAEVRVRPSGGEERVSRYRYDDRGNLLHAESSSGSVDVTYDEQNRIKTLTDNQGRSLEFEYNARSRPTVIRAGGHGELRVSYRDDGEILKVDSDAGRGTALEVTATFQNLLELVRPASVSETF